MYHLYYLRAVKCILHYLTSCNQLVHYFQTDKRIIIIFYPKSKNKRENLTLNLAFNDSTASISFLGNIFAVGGQPHSNETYKINLNTCKFIKKTNMVRGKSEHGLCIANGEIYSIGRYDNPEYLNDCQVYSISYDKWRSLPPLCTPSSCTAAFSFNNKIIYALGGGIANRI